MMDGRPPTSAGKRPSSGQQLPSRSGGGSMVPGTASRLISASNNRPGTRGTVGLLSHIKVVERPMSQQGLVTPRTALRQVPRRQVQDKSYFIGLLRGRVSELISETGRLGRELEHLHTEQSTCLTYEKRAESQALELKDLQGQLADYNLLVDKLNMDTEMPHVQQEYQELKAENESEAQSIDALFEQRRDREMQLSQLEAEIAHEQNATENLTATMAPDLHLQYQESKKALSELQFQLEELQHHLDTLTTQKMALEEELSMSQETKREAFHLQVRLREVEEKKNNLVLEEEGKGTTPQQERENLVQQVKEHNAEIVSMERQRLEAKEQSSRLREELEQAEQEQEEQRGERMGKYKELKKREETMDGFLDAFDDNATAAIEKRSQMESAIVALLEKLSRNLDHFQHMPTPHELSLLRDDLHFKEGEMEKSRITVLTLSNEQKKLAMDLAKIEQLEGKIQQELETLQKKITSMEKEMDVYSDIETLKRSAEGKRNALIEEEKLLRKQREATKQVMSELKNNHETLRNKLSDNETYTQLCNLERRWQHLEQNNFAMCEFVACKKAQTDYSSSKLSVTETLRLFNQAQR